MAQNYWNPNYWIQILSDQLGGVLGTSSTAFRTSLTPSVGQFLTKKEKKHLLTKAGNDASRTNVSTRWWKKWRNLIPDLWRSLFTIKRVTFSPSQKGHQQNCQACELWRLDSFFSSWPRMHSSRASSVFCVMLVFGGYSVPEESARNRSVCTQIQS